MSEELKALLKGRVTPDMRNFHLTGCEYRALSLELQKELDRNFWRFSFRGGYDFHEMEPEAKAMFADQEMVIHHSIFED